MIRPALRNVAWSGVEASCAALLSIASAFLVARLIGPAELGIGAAAISVHILLWVTVNALFGDALVQRTTVDDAVMSSAVWTSVGVGCAAMAVQAGSGWLLAECLHDSRLVPMALCLALPLPLVGAAGVTQGMLTRMRGYGRLAGRTIVGQGLGTLAGVLAALGGAGAWAPVTQQCVTSVAGALALFVGAGLRLQLRWQWEPVRALLSIGLPLTASTLAQHARYRLFALLIGGSAGAMALGEVHVAFRLVDTVRELSFTALWRLMLPILSERQNERAAMLAAVDRLLDASTLVMLPLCGALVLTVGPVVALLLGPGWAASGLAALPLVGLMAALAITFPSGVALVAVGKAHYALFANLAGIAATIAGVLLIAPATPLAAVLVWCGAHAIVIPYALWANARALGVGPLRPLREAVPMLAVAATAVLVALQAPPVADTPVSLIALRLFKGGLVVAAFLILRKWGPSLATLHNLVQPLAPARVPGASRRPTLFPSSAIRSTVAENHAGENEPCAPPMPSSRS